MVIIRIGDGRTPSGKILDRDTHYYMLSEKEDAIKDAIESGKKIYISKHNKKYEELSINELKAL